MSPDLAIGMTHEQTTTVSDALLVPAMAPSFPSFAPMPPVFATAYLVAFIEWACIEALAPYLDETEASVGTHIDVSHLAATPLGMKVTARVELIELNGRKLRFKVSCRDEADLIGEGVHERAVIKPKSFNERLAPKAALVQR